MEAAAQKQDQKLSNTEQRAIEYHGRNLNKPWHAVFASLVAQGASYAEAYRKTHPDCSDNTARHGGCVAAAHPQMAELIQIHRLGSHGIGKAHLPEAVWTMIQSMRDGTEGDRIKLQAARTLADRFGAPKTQQIVANARVELLDSLQDAIEGEVGDEDVEADDLPQLPRESGSQSD